MGRMIDFDRIIEIAEAAGKAILDIYEKYDNFQVESKTDLSPITVADKESHKLIKFKLKDMAPEIPVLSEEGKDIPYEIRKNWEMFWLVDPLDGTKEFIKKNGEFTVNIALIKGNGPVFGVINVPVKGITYFAIRNEGAFKKVEGSLSRIKVSNFDPENVRVVASRSHMNEKTKKFIEKLKREYGNVSVVLAGSSLKFCLIAEGKADIYPRFGPTMEWDTAAGHVIVETAGGTLKTMDGSTLTYNKENLLNPYFVVENRGNENA